MSHTVIVHLVNEEFPVVGEVENLPEGGDQVIPVSNVRRRDGCPVSFVSPETGTVIFPWTRILCVEVMPQEAFSPRPEGCPETGDQGGG